MKTDWTLPANYIKGERNIFKKPVDQKGTQRLVIVANKHQRKIIDAYCRENGFSYGQLFRLALSEYFERIGYDLPPDQPEDNSQLKIFPEQ